MNLSYAGKMLMMLGGVIFVLGLVMSLTHKIPFLGRLPGDIVVQRRNFTFYFPLATSLVISAVLSLLFWVWSRR